MSDILTAPLAAALRTATRAAHHQIDHHPLLAPLVRPGLTLAHYQHVLQVMQRVHVPLQAALAATLTRLGLTYQLADRAAWLAQDLEYLGAAPNERLPEWTPPVPTGVAELVGILYVIEGSTLGGQVIARQLAEMLDVDAARGARFFNGWGSATQRHWQAYWQFAGTHCAAADEAAACRAAVGLFDSLRQLFDRTLAGRG